MSQKQTRHSFQSLLTAGSWQCGLRVEVVVAVVVVGNDVIARSFRTPDKKKWRRCKIKKNQTVHSGDKFANSRRETNHQRPYERLQRSTVADRARWPLVNTALAFCPYTCHVPTFACKRVLACRRTLFHLASQSMHRSSGHVCVPMTSGTPRFAAACNPLQAQGLRRDVSSLPPRQRRSPTNLTNSLFRFTGYFCFQATGQWGCILRTTSTHKWYKI